MSCGVAPRVYLSIVTLTFLCVSISDVRAAPFGPGNILTVTTDTHRLAEYTPGGLLVQSLDIPYPGGPYPTTEYPRDVAMMPDGNAAIYNGTFDPYLTTYHTKSNTFSHDTILGWSTINNTTYGGIAAYQSYLFLTDMNTGPTGEPDQAWGLIRYNTLDNSFQRVTAGLTGISEPIDVNVGLDGLVYVLLQTERYIRVYNPITLAIVRNIPLPVSVRGIAANAQGQVFAASLDTNIYKFGLDGSILRTLDTGSLRLTDIDLNADGQIIAGTDDNNTVPHFVLTSDVLSVATIVPIMGNPYDCSFVAFTTPVPEPASIAIMFLGVGGVRARYRRMR